MCGCAAADRCFSSQCRQQFFLSSSLLLCLWCRQNLREYVSQINLVASQTGLPMLRPMLLQFPNDAVCQTGERCSAECVWRAWASQLRGQPPLQPPCLACPCALLSPVMHSEAVSGQFMFGPSWLVAPVTTVGATNATVYLPPLSPALQWVYWYNQTVVAATGWVTIPTDVSQFPLFYQQPTPPSVVQLE